MITVDDIEKLTGQADKKKQEEAKIAQELELAEAEINFIKSRYCASFLSDEEFQRMNGYGYDVLLALSVILPSNGEESKEESKEKTTEDTDGSPYSYFIANRLYNAGLEFEVIYSKPYNKLFFLIRAPPHRLHKEALHTNFVQQLDPEKARAKAEAGNPEMHIKPFRIEHKTSFSKCDPYDHIFVPYRSKAAEQGLYKKYDNAIFITKDRLKLIMSILESPVKEPSNGCRLLINHLISSNKIDACFPLTSSKELENVLSKIIDYKVSPFHLPINPILHYFGEKIALYFAFLGYYTSFLVVSGLIGLIFWIIVLANGNNPDTAAVPYFGYFIMIWSGVFQALWDQQRQKLNVKWGMVGFEQRESLRPEFEGVIINSYIDGKPIKYFPEWKKKFRFTLSVSVVAIMIGIVLTAVGSIFRLRVYLDKKNYSLGGLTGSNIAAVINAVQIQILNFCYAKLSVFMTDYENHRTDTEYEDSLISKTFLFQFVNSYSSLFYIAFVAKSVGDDCSYNNNCMKVLNIQLGTIFLLQIFSNVFEMGLPVIKKFASLCTANRSGAKDIDSFEESMTPYEKQFELDTYDILMGTFQDYLELVVQFGYCTMFATAFPLAPTLALINNLLEFRVDGFKICRLMRRPWPAGAEDIGAWEHILTMISSAAIIVNSALICFTGSFYSLSSVMKVWLFIIMCVAIFGVRYFTYLVVPDVPRIVQIQVARQEFIQSKLIDLDPDLDDDITVIADDSEDRIHYA